MADVKISELTPGGAVTGGETFEVVQAGNSRRLTLRELSATPMNTYASSGYTLVLADQGRVVESTNPAANALTVPPNSSVAFPIGATILLRQFGTGQMSVVAGAGVTVLRKASRNLNLAEQYSEAVLHKRGTNEWLLTGELEIV